MFDANNIAARKFTLVIDTPIHSKMKLPYAII